MHLHGTLTPVYPSVIAVLTIQSLYYNCKAIQLSCDSDNILEVVEGTSNNNVTCSGLDPTKDVKWWRNTTQIGTCTPPTNGQDTCTGKSLDPTFVPVRKVSSESVMMINTMNPSDNIEIERRSMKCNIYSQSPISCDMDLISPAEGSCLAKFIRRDSAPWGISTECNITKVYSSLGRYKCEMYSVLSNTESRIFTDNSPALTSAGGKYKSFSCAFTGNMPTDEGLYSYKAIITPGRKIITATSIDSLEILRPTKSAVSCSPSPDVPENTNVTCICNTNNIGKPGGRLKWYRGNNQIGTGEYGNSRLVMSQTLTRSDSGVTQFRCDVDWTSVTSGDSFPMSVGYIDTPELTIRLSRNVTVLENEIVQFACQANGKPVPTLSLYNSISNTRLNVTSSPLRYVISTVRCEDAATYTCIASNSIGKDTLNSANLYVNCKPRITPGFDISTVNYMNKTEKQVFTIIAYPSPDNFTFIYLGSDLNKAKEPSDIYLNIICLPTRLVYNNTCTLTVDDVSPSAVGWYKIIIGNKYGSVNFTVKVNISGSIPTDDKINAAAVGGGIAAGVVVIVVVFVFVIVILKRRRKGKKDDNDNESRNMAADGSKVNHAFSPEPQQTEPPPISATTIDKEHIIKEIDPSTAGNSGINQARDIYNLPLLMQPPVLQSRSKPKHGKSDKNKRKNAKKYEGKKYCKEGEYENVSLPTKANAGDAERKTHQNKNKGKESQINAEGITYMELDFSQSKNNKPVQPKPVEEHVEYAPIDFSKHTS